MHYFEWVDQAGGGWEGLIKNTSNAKQTWDFKLLGLGEELEQGSASKA